MDLIDPTGVYRLTSEDKEFLTRNPNAFKVYKGYETKNHDDLTSILLARKSAKHHFKNKLKALNEAENEDDARYCEGLRKLRHIIIKMLNARAKEFENPLLTETEAAPPPDYPDDITSSEAEDTSQTPLFEEEDSKPIPSPSSAEISNDVGKPRNRERKLKIIVRGLDTDSDILDLNAEITDLGFTILNSRQFRRRRGQSYKLLPLFLIILPYDEKHLGFYKLEALLNKKIQLERFRGGNFQIQCFKCQGYGHTQRDCPNDPACMKCAGGHFSFTCTKPRETPPLCCNCHQSHTSNFSGCSARPRKTKPKTKHHNPAQELLSTVEKLKTLLQDQSLLTLLQELINTAKLSSKD